VALRFQPSHIAAVVVAAATIEAVELAAVTIGAVVAATVVAAGAAFVRWSPAPFSERALVAKTVAVVGALSSPLLLPPAAVAVAFLVVSLRASPCLARRLCLQIRSAL
jgi:hypothetical protein